MTIFDALKRDHDAVKALLPLIEPERDAVAAKDRFDELKSLVIGHSRAEEDVFYSELEEFDLTEEHVEQSTEEHQEIEAMLQALSDGDIGAATWRAAFADMTAALLRHIGEEEGALFKQATALLTESDLARMSAAFTAEKRRWLEAEDRAAAKTAPGAASARR